MRPKYKNDELWKFRSFIFFFHNQNFQNSVNVITLSWSQTENIKRLTLYKKWSAITIQKFLFNFFSESWRKTWRGRNRMFDRRRRHWRRRPDQLRRVLHHDDVCWKIIEVNWFNLKNPLQYNLFKYSGCRFMWSILGKNRSYQLNENNNQSFYIAIYCNEIY